MGDSIHWDLIRRFDEYLDENVSQIYKEHPQAQDWARVAKVSEESGEAIQAFIGFTGQNPRKGQTHTLNDVENELADVAGTAILAIQHFTKSEAATYAILQSWFVKLEAYMKVIKT